ncbi:MAG: hypothetical protein N3D17_07530 [bacterium]|nr:hypothetical protein [bacterium]
MRRVFFILFCLSIWLIVSFPPASLGAEVVKDEFNSNTLNSEMWEVIGSGSVSVDGSAVKFAGPSGENWGNAGLLLKKPFVMDEENNLSFSITIKQITAYRAVRIFCLPEGHTRLSEEPESIELILTFYPPQLICLSYPEGVQKDIKDLDSKIFAVEYLPNNTVINITFSLKELIIDISTPYGLSKSFRAEHGISPFKIVKPYYVAVVVNNSGNSSPATALIERIEVKGKIAEKREEEHAVIEDGYFFISIDKAANRTFEDNIPGDNEGGWTDQGNNDMRYIPKGKQVLRKVPFYIIDTLDIWGKWLPSCIVLLSKNSPCLPERSIPIEVGRTAPYLYFLHTCAWGVQPNNTYAKLLIRYEDGSISEIPLRVGVEANDWWECKDGEKGKVAWVGKNDMREPVGVYVLEWENPYPGKKIKDIIFESTNTETIPILIAITGSEKRIEIGKEPTRMVTKESLCEYRHIPVLTLDWREGESKVYRVYRGVPVESEIVSVRVKVKRYSAREEGEIICRIGGVEKSRKVEKDEWATTFDFTEKEVIRYLNANRGRHQIEVEIKGKDNIGYYNYETNPYVDWIPDGEDEAHRIYGITGIYMVRSGLPIHEISGYIDTRPRARTALPVEEIKVSGQQVSISDINKIKDAPRHQVCLNGIWEFVAGGQSDKVPQDGWQRVVVPGDFREEVFKANAHSAWFRMYFDIPEFIVGNKRISLFFEAVADYAKVMVNGKVCGENEGGISPFEIDITDAVKPGKNELLLYCEDVLRHIVPRKVKRALSEEVPTDEKVVHWKGYAYKIQILRGPWYLPNDVWFYLDDREVGIKAESKEEVAEKGDGRYFREDTWNRSFLYFSTPGNVPLEKIVDRYSIEYYYPGVRKYLGVMFQAHEWRNRRPLSIGPYQDVYLVVTPNLYIKDVFVMPSVRKKNLSVELSLNKTIDKKAEVEIVTSVLDNRGKEVIRFPSEKVEVCTKEKKITVSFPVGDRLRLWDIDEPYLHFLKVELVDETGNRIDVAYKRFGFRELWAEGGDFYLNGRKIFLQGTSPGNRFREIPSNRFILRLYYADMRNNTNINFIRWHQGGTENNAYAEIADELGILLEPETPIVAGRGFYIADEKTGEYIPERVKLWQEQIEKQVIYLRNHPSIVIWSVDNENLTSVQHNAPVNEKDVEYVLSWNAFFKGLDPTRLLDNHGDSDLVFYIKDPRVDIYNYHYPEPKVLTNWREKFAGKPVIIGEESLGTDVAWTFQGRIMEKIEKGEDPMPTYWKDINGACRYIQARIRLWRAMGISGIMPFSLESFNYNPERLIWDGWHWGSTHPAVYPAYSGEEIKPSVLYQYSPGQYNFFDPSAPKNYVSKLHNTIKDSFSEVPSVKATYISPEVIVKVEKGNGMPVINTTVWLVPLEEQASNPEGVLTDNEGRAWFRCKAGGGRYLAIVKIEDKWYKTELSPSIPGEWNQIKTVVMKVE